MTVELKKTDVVVVGLGAAGGFAVLPLVEAGLEVIGLEAGAVDTVKNDIGTMGTSTHAYGGARMGDNPDTSVVDRWGFSPTLTAQALAWRTADHLVTNWETIA